MSNKYGTPFTESEVFLAATEQDMVEINRILDTMLVGEVRRLREACNFLHDLAHTRLEQLSRIEGGMEGGRLARLGGS